MIKIKAEIDAGRRVASRGSPSTVLWCREGPVWRRDRVGAGRAQGRARCCQHKAVLPDAGSYENQGCPGAGGNGRGPARVERARGGQERSREGPVWRRDRVGGRKGERTSASSRHKAVSHDAGSCASRACPGAGGDGRGPGNVERARGVREGGTGRSRSVGERGGGAREARRPWSRRTTRRSC